MTADRPQIQIVPAESPAAIETVRMLFREYAASLAVDLCFQDFGHELATLPGGYTPPAGALLLALVDGQAAGCGAMRLRLLAHHPGACEMKRLYVRPAFRGLGLGRLLAQQLMRQAAQAGHRCMLLDTLDDMASARALYASLGYVEVPPYYDNPIPGARYLKAELAASGSP